MLNNVGMVSLETERLFLRKFEVSDAQDMFDNWASSQAVCRFLSWEPHGSVESTKELLTSWVNSYQNSNTYNWVITLKDSSEAVGSLSVIDMSQRHMNCEVGYCIGEKYWNKGITTEALKAVIRFMFETVGVIRIQARHDTKNMASGRVMEKSGMRFEGTMRSAKIRKDGSVGDLNIRAITRDDYESERKLGHLHS